ncbi:MAG: acyl carrier protein [Gammaproteobacteria bacterium]|nr:MAG: acyl carrier protein [Gammaproteobacteria bacterium]
MENLQQEIKQLIIDALSLEDITADDIDAQAPLFGEGLGLDSIDALELGVAIKQQYHINIKGKDENTIKKHFYSVKTLANYIGGYSAQGNRNE